MVFQKLELLRGEPRQTIGGKPRQESVPKFETTLALLSWLRTSRDTGQ